MRIHLKIHSDGNTVPFNHQHQLTGAMHKWIGKENTEHGALSLFSFSMLEGGKKSKNGDGLVFENGSSFFISAHSSQFIKTVIENIQKDPVLFNGLAVNEIIIQEDPQFTNSVYFQVASPILIKRRLENGRIKHFAFNEEGANSHLTETLQNKLKKAGISDASAKVRFDDQYTAAKCKVILYNKVQNKTNICPVIIEGKPETIAFAWNVGIGNSTGIGLGAIK
jgi:CRISPR-associated endoribonuclease Cas6